MRVGICAGAEEERERLAELVRAHFFRCGAPLELRVFSDGEELLCRWQDSCLDCVFVDLDMAGLPGMETARRLRKLDRRCAIIFTAGTAQYAIDSYEVRAADYLLKPVKEEEVDQALDWCRETLPAPRRELEITCAWERRTLPVDQIHFIEVYGQACLIHTDGVPVRTNQRLNVLEKALGDEGFLRCHRSYLVNMEYILCPQGQDFLLMDHSRVPIATKNAGRIKQIFFEWSFRQRWGGS